MKKYLIAIICTVLLFSLCGCTKSTDYYRFVSQERRDILRGENENYSVDCFLEMREKPFKPDGKKQETAYAVIIKLTVKSGENGILSGAKVTFSTDKDYSALFSFHRESDNYVAVSYVSLLPEKSLSVTLEANGQKETIQLDSILGDFEFKPREALETALSKSNDKYAAAKSGNLEINIRLICGDAIFYYVGLVTEDKTDAFLISADGKKIVSEKTISN